MKHSERALGVDVGKTSTKTKLDECADVPNLTLWPADHAADVSPAAHRRRCSPYATLDVAPDGMILDAQFVHRFRLVQIAAVENHGLCFPKDVRSMIATADGFRP